MLCHLIWNVIIGLLNLHQRDELLNMRKVQFLICYAGLLTPYAFGFLKSQLESVQKVTIAQDIDEDSCSITTANGSITVSINCCSCGFFTSMKLPCHHILAVRHHKGLPQFHESLCCERWKLSYFLQNHHVYRCNNTEDNMSIDGDTADGTHVTQTTIEQQARVLTEHEKYRKAFILAQDIAQKLSTKGMDDFEEGMGDLKFLDEMWSKGKRVRILEMETETGLITIDVCNKFINCA